MLRRTLVAQTRVFRAQSETIGAQKVVTNKTLGGSGSLFPQSTTEYFITVPKFRVGSEGEFQKKHLNEEAAKVEAAAKAEAEKVETMTNRKAANREVMPEKRERGGTAVPKAKPIKTKPEHVLITGDGPTLTFDFSADDADFEHGNEAKREMEELRRRLTPQKWKAFIEVLDKASGEPGFQGWAEQKNLEQLYTELMRAHYSETRRAWRRKWLFIPFACMGIYGVVWPYHFFNMF